jgi:DNA-binding transcriptional LysR family regulator
MKNLPELRLLATFSAVVAHGSMTEAANALGYVPSAVSQQIKALERSMGVELLVRRPGSRIAVTTEGRALSLAASRLFAATADFQHMAQRIAEREVTELRIGAYGTASSHLLPSVLSGLIASGAGPALHMVDVETREGLPMLGSGDLDLLIAHRYLPEDPPAESDDYVTTLLGRERMLLVAAEATDGESPTFGDCVERDWAAGKPPDLDRRLLQRWASEVGVRPQVRYETSDCHVQISLVASGLAVALLPATVVFAWSDSSRPVTLVEMPPDSPAPARDVIAVTRTGYRPPIVDVLLGRLADSLEAVKSRRGNRESGRSQSG